MSRLRQLGQRGVLTIVHLLLLLLLDAGYPGALLPWKSCRALVACQRLGPRTHLEWCAPAVARQTWGVCDTCVVGGAARQILQQASAPAAGASLATEPPAVRARAASQAAAAARAAARESPEQHLPHQYCGPPVPWAPQALTPAQVGACAGWCSAAVLVGG